MNRCSISISVKSLRKCQPRTWIPLDVCRKACFPTLVCLPHPICTAHVLLIKPQLRDDTQLRLDRAKMLWAIANDYNSLLHRTPCNLGRSVDELAGVQLPRTRYAEQRRGGVGRGLSAAEGEVRVVFGRGMRAITQGHKGQQRPVIINRWVGPLFCAEPCLDFWSSRIITSALFSCHRVYNCSWKSPVFTLCPTLIVTTP